MRPGACFLRQGVVWPRGCAAALGKTCARPPALAAKAGARPVVLGIHLLGSKTNVAARRRAFRITAAGGGCPPAAPFRMTGCCPAKALCARRAKAFPGQRGAARQTRPRRGALHAARALAGGRRLPPPAHLPEVRRVCARGAVWPRPLRAVGCQMVWLTPAFQRRPPRCFQTHTRPPLPLSRTGHPRTPSAAAL